MITYFDIVLLLFFGALGGFLSGFLGVGGGIVFVPLLDFFLKKYFIDDSELVKAILANSLFIIMFSTAAASYKQYKIGNLHSKEILNTLIPGLISVILAHYLINMGNWYKKSIFLYVFLVLLLMVIVKMFLKKKNDTPIKNDQEVSFNKMRFIGFFTGIITAMSGLGGGIIMTPLFSEWLKLDIKRASAISTIVIFGFASVIAVLNASNSPSNYVIDYQYGYIVLPLVIPIIFGSFLLVQFGVNLAQKTKSKNIKLIFASFATVVLLKVIYEITHIHFSF
jgi:uncharacterized membrane protein YfcA